eukprot:3779276-Amphidinium_carterae.1
MGVPRLLLVPSLGKPPCVRGAPSDRPRLGPTTVPAPVRYVPSAVLLFSFLFELLRPLRPILARATLMLVLAMPLADGLLAARLDGSWQMSAVDPDSLPL